MTAVNAKYIHSSLAVRSVFTYCEDFKENIIKREFTINNDEDYILREIYLLKPEVISFSCYIWNINMIKNIISNVKKVLSKVKIILGGPEVSYEYDEILKKYADIIIIGEGEKTFYEVADYFINGGELEKIAGIAFKKENGEIVKNIPRAPLKLDEIPFAYKAGIDDLDNKIIYYEASRGCPYSCQYCLSSIEKGIRFLSLERVYSDLGFFIEKKVKQVKFVDRTFNADKSFAMAIWKFLIKNDNGITNFHFEISADILNDEMLDILKTARKGLFQLEIGVQSTNDATLRDIKRKTSLEKLFEKVIKIKSFKNIHQHLDLIAGLPEEDYDSFRKSFNDVFSLYPEQLQLGFLKLLRGSGLRADAEKYGIVYRQKAPYEVLYTKEVSFEQMLRLKGIEEMVETYYNSGKCLHTIRLSQKYFTSAFDFFEELSIYWEKIGANNVSHSKMHLYEIMFEFLKEKFEDRALLQDVIRFDILMNDNLKNLPSWLGYELDEETKNKQLEFFNDEEKIDKFIPRLKSYSFKQLIRMCCLESFNYDFYSWIENDFERLEKKKAYLLFEYTSLGFNSGALCHSISK